MVAFIIKLFLINSINNQVVINYYFNNNTFDTLPNFLYFLFLFTLCGHGLQIRAIRLRTYPRHRV